MLFKAKTVKGYKLDSLDGEIGKVQEFYFDDRHWTIRYLVVDTGTWLTGRQVLISPYAMGGHPVLHPGGSYFNDMIRRRGLDDFSREK